MQHYVSCVFTRVQVVEKNSGGESVDINNSSFIGGMDGPLATP